MGGHHVSNAFYVLFVTDWEPVDESTAHHQHRSRQLYQLSQHLCHVQPDSLWDVRSLHPFRWCRSHNPLLDANSFSPSSHTIWRITHDTVYGRPPMPAALCVVSSKHVDHWW